MIVKTIILCLLTAVTLLAQSATEFQILASDGATNDQFGKAVAVDGDYAIVGAYWDDDNGSNSGSVYFYHRTDSSWNEIAKVTAADGSGGDYLGGSVDIDGDYAIAGAWLSDPNGDQSGSAYIFFHSDTGWVEYAKLTSSDAEPDDRIGNSVAIQGDLAIVATKDEDENGSNAGAVYVFRNIGGTWTEEAKVTPSDAEPNDRFGYDCYLDGDRLLVGARRDDDNGEDSGSAYVFAYSDTGWVEQAKLTASDAGEQDQFGYSVALEGDYAVIGAYWNDANGEESGAAYMFEYNAGSDTWEETVKLTASDGDLFHEFGSSVCISGDYVVIGSHFDSANGIFSGSAYLFHRNAGQWTEYLKLTAGDPDGGDEFGVSVFLQEPYVIVGAIGDDENGEDAGAAYVYNIADLTSLSNSDEPVVQGITLYENYPNPFNPSTTIRYHLPSAATVDLSIFNLLGQRVKTLVSQPQPAGLYRVAWNGKNDAGRLVASSTYLYRLEANGVVLTRPLTLVR